MNWYLATAGVLTALAGPLHSVLGERLIFKELFQQELPRVGGSDVLVKRILRVFWHLIDIAWWGLAAILFFLASRPELDDVGRWIGVIVAATFLASAVYAFVGTRGRHFSWGIFLAIAVLSWIGVR